MAQYNPPLKFILDLDNFKTASEMAMVQIPGRASLESLSEVNIEIDITNNKLIFSKPGMNFEGGAIVKKWYK